MSPSLLAGLNPSQRKAVLHNKGPLLVLAGAGSGKTRVLTTRVARLVKEEVCRPSAILAVTFTNKAAAEMRERLAGLLGTRTAEKMTVSTFHSFGAAVLREHGEAVGVKRNFTIFDEHEKLSCLKAFVRERTASKEPQKLYEVAQRISRHKNAGLDPTACPGSADLGIKVGKVWRDYEKSLRARQAVDFDDLLLLPLRILEQHATVLEHYRKRYQYLCIDEYQDTNAVQMRLARMLAAPRNNIMVVGDDDQSIYAWRGADSANVLGFGQAYPRCTTVILDVNYRSTRQIVDAAMAVVANNRSRKPKVISAAAGEGELIRHYRGEDETDEAQWVAKDIRQQAKEEGQRYSDCCLLFRTNAMMRRFEQELRHESVPYRVIGAMSFFERREVKDILAYMRVLSNPDDELSLARVLKVPESGITKSTLAALEELAARRHISLQRALEHFEEAGELAGLQGEKCALMRDWCRASLADMRHGPASRALRQALDRRDYLGYLRAAVKDEEHGAERLENVEEMLHGLEVYERRAGRNATLAGYIQDLALQASDEDDKEKDALRRSVTLMTIHKAKGLEFPCVYVVGLDDTVLPSPRTVAEGNIEEERRLFYVAMTRARQRLVLTWPHRKLFRLKDIAVTPTRFVREIPQEFLDGPLGEKQAAERKEFIEDFYKQMQEKFASTPPPTAS
jgi:DNA helicase II / ATP-dependent DNA helicase PcrA